VETPVLIDPTGLPVHPPKAKAKTAKSKKKKVKTTKPKAARPLTRPCRIDMRLSRAEKSKLQRKAKADGCTLTDVVSKLIERLK
jgi:hypothetical protein